VILDDATSRIYYAQLVEEESTPVWIASRLAKAARYSRVSTRAARDCSRSSSGDCH
jgi:hypothetical protein